jgi:hypothetical protein
VFILTARGCFGLVVAVTGVIGDFFLCRRHIGVGNHFFDAMHASKGNLDVFV